MIVVTGMACGSFRAIVDPRNKYGMRIRRNAMKIVFHSNIYL